MKKILIITITLFTLLSCSSDDENISDPIIGKWKIKSATIINACSSKTTLEFNSDNMVNVISFSDDNENSNCISSTKTAHWKFISGTTYSTTMDSNDESFIDVNIVFSNNNNTFNVTNSSGFQLVYNKI